MTETWPKDQRRDMVWQSYLISTQAKQHKPNIFSPDRRSFGKICRQGNDGDHFEQVSYSSWFVCLILFAWFGIIRICNYLLFFAILLVHYASDIPIPCGFHDYITFLIFASRLPEAMDTERLKWKDQPGSIEGAACVCPGYVHAFLNFPILRTAAHCWVELFLRPKASQNIRWLQYFCSCAREPLQLFFEAGLAAGTRLSGSAQAQHSVGNEWKYWKWMGNVWWFWCILLSEFKRIWLQTSANQKVSSKMTVNIYIIIYIYGDNYYVTF